jgi:hypothetical protein
LKIFTKIPVHNISKLMKDFCNILEAANYHKKCYRCQSDMIPYFNDERVAASRLDQSGRAGLIEINLSASTDSDTDDILTINPFNNKISLEYHPRYKIKDWGYIDYGQSTISKSTINNYNGTLYEGLDVRCCNCTHFSYTIQLVIDIAKEYRIQQLFLNSEMIIWLDEKGLAYEIRNAYTIGKTECFSFNGNKRGQQISIPLIPLNLSNPEETLARIKKLNLFS